jgi:signal peptidase I
VTRLITDRPPPPPRGARGVITTIRRSVVAETIIIIIAAIALALLIQYVAVKPFVIPSESMEPILEKGDRILVYRGSQRLGHRPDRGDIVVFNPPKCAGNGVFEETSDPQWVGRCFQEGLARADQNYVKRVIGLPGETLQIRGFIVFINGRPLLEPYVHNPGKMTRGPGCTGVDGENWEKGFTIPKDHFFMMGDNRGASLDSRCWGSLPGAYIIGDAFFRYWPPWRWKLI